MKTAPRRESGDSRSRRPGQIRASPFPKVQRLRRCRKSGCKQPGHKPRWHLCCGGPWGLPSKEGWVGPARLSCRLLLVGGLNSSEEETHPKSSMKGQRGRYTRHQESQSHSSRRKQRSWSHIIPCSAPSEVPPRAAPWVHLLHSIYSALTRWQLRGGQGSLRGGLLSQL